MPTQNPSTLQDVIKVNLSIVRGSFPGGSVALAALVSQFAAPDAWAPATRQKLYTGSPSDILEAIVADGFAETSAAYLMAEAFLDDETPVSEVLIGRRDAGDASAAAALAAVEAEAEAGATPHAFAIVVLDTRTKADQVSAATWCESRWKLFVPLTREPGALTGAPGTFAAAGFAAKWLRTAAVWHDAEVATGYGPAVATGAPGTFSISDGLTLVVVAPAGTAEQTFTFDSAAATSSGTNGAPYKAVWKGDVVFSGTDDVGVTVDALAPLFVPSNTSSDQTATDLRAAWNASGAHAAVATAGGAGDDFQLSFLNTSPHTVTPYSPGAADIVNGAFTKTPLQSGQTILVAFDGGAGVVVTLSDDVAYFPTGIKDATATQLAEYLNDNYPQATWGVSGSALTITSQHPGSGSEIDITGGTALTAIGLTVGTTSGSGDFADAEAATAAEVAAEINLTATGFTASAVGTRLRLTSTAEGEDATLEVVGGDAAAELGLDATTYSGTGVQEDYLDAKLAGRIAVLASRLDTPGGSFPLYNQKLRAQGDALTSTQRSAAHAQYLNTYEVRTSNFPGELSQGVTFAGVNIDFVVLSLWLQLRLAEAVKAVLDSYAVRKQRIPYSDPGIAIVDNQLTGVFVRAGASGGMQGPDLAPFDELTKLTGWRRPTIAEQSAANRAAGKISGWRTVQLDAGAVKAVEMDVILSTQ